MILVGEKAYKQGVDIQVQIWWGMVHEFPAIGKILPKGKKLMNKFSKYEEYLVSL